MVLSNKRDMLLIVRRKKSEMNNQTKTEVKLDQTVSGRGQASGIKTETSDKQRQIGFEILRIVSIFLIGCVHILNAGGVLANDPTNWGLKLLYSVFLISVNAFVLISGYFLVESKITFKKIAKLWLQVLFYNILCYAVSVLFFRSQTGVIFNIVEVVKLFFPIIRNSFWFFTAYFFMYVTSPFLNMVVKNSTKKQLSLLLIGLFILNIFTSRLWPVYNIVNVNSGYSYFWFVALYMTAAYFRLYPPKCNRFVFLGIYLFSTILTWIFSYINCANKNAVIGLLWSGFEYNSTLVVVASISIFLFFANIVSPSKKLNKVVSFVSSCTFGIYLLQCSCFQRIIYFSILKVQTAYGSIYSPLFVLLFALELFALGFLVELVRKTIFKLLSKPTLKLYGQLEKVFVKTKQNTIENTNNNNENAENIKTP